MIFHLEKFVLNKEIFIDNTFIDTEIFDGGAFPIYFDLKVVCLNVKRDQNLSPREISWIIQRYVTGISTNINNMKKIVIFIFQTYFTKGAIATEFDELNICCETVVINRNVTLYSFMKLALISEINSAMIWRTCSYVAFYLALSEIQYYLQYANEIDRIPCLDNA